MNDPPAAKWLVWYANAPHKQQTSRLLIYDSEAVDSSDIYLGAKKQKD